MKVVKPQKLGVLSKTFEANGECYLAVGLLAFFPIGPPDSRALLPEAAMWKLTAEELGEVVLDECMPKAKAELLVAGHAFAPGGQACAATTVRVASGTIDKTLYVAGDRYWVEGRPSAPIPFVQMPLSYGRAFGGQGHALNPGGKGMVSVEVHGQPLTPLPNIEDPRAPVASPGARPEPAGLGPYDVSWPQRFAKAGTYDLAWLKTGFPGFARDLDWQLFNRAPKDQWSGENHFLPDQPFVVEGMHPKRARLEGRLPGIVGRCFINGMALDGDDTREQFRELETRLDTVWLFPHVERGVAIFHGMIRVREDDAADVLQLVAAFEDPGAPRPVEHYEELLRLRLDKDKGAIAALDDAPLLPAFAEKAADEPPGAAAPDVEDPMEANFRRRAEREVAAARERVARFGLDPDDYVPALPPPPPKPKSLEEALEMGERAQAEAEAMAADAERKAAAREPALRELAASGGMDFDALKKQISEPAGGPPRFSAEQEIAKLDKMAADARAGGTAMAPLEEMATDPKLRQRLVEAEAQIRDAYRMSAHLQGPARALTVEARQALRERALKGGSLAEQDLTGADLEGLDLRGRDFRGAWLEGASLGGADLRGADFTGAVLARADLKRARLDDARFGGANLGAARLEGATGERIDFEKAILARAILTGAVLRQSRFAEADWYEAVLRGADLAGASAPQLLLLKTDLSGIRLLGATLAKATFLECRFDDADFSGADLEGATFVSAVAIRMRLPKASLVGARFVKECVLEGADFEGAALVGANLRGARLNGANFEGAKLDGADLSECDLSRARLRHVRAREARFVKANLADANLVGADLMGAILQKADLRGADLLGASLFAADFARIFGDSRTNLREANQKKVRIYPLRQARQP